MVVFGRRRTQPARRSRHIEKMERVRAPGWRKNRVNDAEEPRTMSTVPQCYEILLPAKMPNVVCVCACVSALALATERAEYAFSWQCEDIWVSPHNFKGLFESEDFILRCVCVCVHSINYCSSNCDEADVDKLTSSFLCFEVFLPAIQIHLFIFAWHVLFQMQILSRERVTVVHPSSVWFKHAGIPCTNKQSANLHRKRLRPLFLLICRSVKAFIDMHIIKRRPELWAVPQRQQRHHKGISHMLVYRTRAATSTKVSVFLQRCSSAWICSAFFNALHIWLGEHKRCAWQQWCWNWREGKYSFKIFCKMYS